MPLTFSRVPTPTPFPIGGGGAPLCITSVVIANGQTKSAAVDLQGTNLIRINTPAQLTGSTLTFEVSADNSTFVPLYDSAGTAISVSMGTSRSIVVPATSFIGIRYLKLVSGSAEGAERTFSLMSKAF
jgi:hypothetical protein